MEAMTIKRLRTAAAGMLVPAALLVGACGSDDSNQNQGEKIGQEAQKQGEKIGQQAQSQGEKIGQEAQKQGEKIGEKYEKAYGD